MQLVAKGDPRARNMLGMRLCDRVRRLQRGLLADAADADDAAQESLVEIMRAASSYRGESSLEHWSSRIAVRTGLRHRKRQRARRVEDGRDPDELHRESPSSPMQEALPRPLEAYLTELPLNERRALFLKHALGYTVPEIAELTDTARSTVKFWLASGLKRVRKSIRRDVAIGTGGRS